MGRLSRIEVDNFKSYKGHQIIGPFHDFTSVIGPNGSGKSNLMDAISFVLGVHSSHLRSQNLKDMIYRSSALKSNEQGAASSSTETSRSPRRASVMAVYQDDDGREIKFMRVVQQNGSSEYRINNRVVPYLKYNEELEKQNILVKAKNFLVFQGDVESVASQNPKDLTHLIEQISGSWEHKEEYDRLKLEQERAIENSAHAFNKKRGVTAEIKQYQEQKAEAEKFETLVRERRELVVQYLLWKLFHVDQKTAALHEERQAKTAQEQAAKHEELALKMKIDNAWKEKAQIHLQVGRKELQLKKLNNQLDDQRPIMINLEEKISHLQKKLAKTQQTGNRLKRDQEQQQAVVDGLNKDLETLNMTEHSYNASIPEPASVSGPSLTPDQLAEYEQLKQQVSVRAVDEQQQLSDLQRKYKLAHQNLEYQESKLHEYQNNEAQLLHDGRQLEETIHDLKAEGQQMTEQLEARKSELASLEQDRKTKHQREVKLNEDLQEVLNKLLKIKADQQETAKESKFKESLVMMKQIYPGVHGKLVDLCRPIQRKYDIAVSTVLGRHMDSIVVEDQKTAIECIQYMREQRVGTATFLPITGLKTSSINDRLRNYVRGARLAFDVINYDKHYENVMQFVCGNTLICDNLQIAKQICFEKKEDLKTVTLDGTVIHRNGLMTGGQSGSDEGRRWQERDVEGLMRTRDKLLSELNELSKSKRMGSAEEIARSDCAGLESRISVLQDETTTNSRKLEGMEGSLQDVRSKIAEVQAAYNQAKENLDDVNQKIRDLKQSIAVIEDQVFADLSSRIGVANIREYEAAQFGASDEVLERRAQFAAQRSRLNTQLAFEVEQLNELIERLQKLQVTFDNDQAAETRLQEELTGLSAKQEKIKSDIEAYKVQLQEQKELETKKQEELDEIRRTHESKGNLVVAFINENAKFDAELDKVHAERVALFRKCKLEDIDLPLLSGNMDDVLMDDESELNDGDAMDLDTPSQRSIRSTDWTVEIDFSRLGREQRADNSARLEKEFQDEIKRRGEEIDQMAPNLKAIDRLEGVEQRLREAEEAFNEARKTTKLAKERYRRFYDAFSHISEKIDQVYKDLTKSITFPLGGTAYLSLEDSEEPYLEGIKYHAMPPMKRFRDMEQLSGGERSVAALALLFAIHSYQPSPFFVLDEVDAALDNTNVAKVANYIREHANANFQFIVISLKNTLYEKAQSLVGIYRDQEFHSSKTLTLKLDQYQE
ncbi:RecF/RecN/SMC [Radiomyces spectabilis]|uniref:RecF/RecN/SMC n=1 Tax=Radiomyces spectabilis TaxID=64574 RepID=UPI00221E3E22|nr:RecF/RecN/SMC [Radiomyces spectabilis]KAI8379663.1 RecF/RecN/SMC [Radiomyces spectabilis]